MRRSAAALVFVAMPLALAACATAPAPKPEGTATAPIKPGPVLVRPFAVPEGTVVLDPGFGFAMRRGAPGVPKAVRAASVGRAAAFVVADAIVATLRQAGLEAARAPEGTPVPAGGAVVVSGSFDTIDEGLHHGRRRPSRVAADARVAYQRPGSPPQELLRLHADSQQNPGTSEALDVETGARAAGQTVAAAILDLARSAKWLR